MQSDDIVTRLRRFTANNADWPTIADAADEIERLRAERDEAANEIERLRELLGNPEQLQVERSEEEPC
jgi:hypothetical protein